MVTKKKYFIGSLAALILMYVLFGLTNFSLIDIFRDSYEDSFVDPISYISLFSVLISFILLFFSNEIFKLWLRKIVSWFLPISIVVLIASPDTSTGILSFDRTDFAIFLGFVLVGITLLFALILKFYFRR